jgi:TPP-dependent pyruvate/acetoin dehydrogenase alpha subunit
MEVSGEEPIAMYKKMVEIRCFEEKVGELYALGLIPGLAHPYIGEEAVAVGVCSALRKDDYILSCHRGHGHSIAKGVPCKYILSELLGKETGVCKGIGGSMHSTYLEAGVLFSTALVGGNIPIGTGVGLAIRLKKQDRVVACFFGDGATNTGAFHEGINLASLWKLPVIFVCENNLYGLSTPVSKTVSAKKIADRGVAYDIPGEVVDGMNVLDVRESTLRSAERARKGEGPTLLECRTYRFKGHGMYDIGYGVYRPKEEVEEWMRKCPIERLKKKMLKENIATEVELNEVEKDVKRTVEEAVDFTKESDYPSWDLMTKILYV